MDFKKQFIDILVEALTDYHCKTANGTKEKVLGYITNAVYDKDTNQIVVTFDLSDAVESYLVTAEYDTDNNHATVTINKPAYEKFQREIQEK